MKPRTRKKKTWVKTIVHIILFLAIFFVILLYFSFQWGKANYGNIGMDEIVFTLSMSLEGTSETFINSYLQDALVPAIVIYAVIFLAFHFPTGFIYQIEVKTAKKIRKIQIFPLRFHAGACSVCVVAGFLAICLMANQTFALFSYISNQIRRSDVMDKGINVILLFSYISNQIRRSAFIEENYVDPNSVSLDFPEEKRNLIWIYMESAETSTQDTENGGLFDVNYIPEMTQIAKENVSFSQSDLIEGASVAPGCGWTIAALVAQTAGLPLKLYSNATGKIDNSMKNYDYFLPGATSLGDILEENGYQNYFMAGSNFKFGGRTNYFSQHGDYDIYDYKRAITDGKIDSDYKVWWGFEDEKLYEFAKEKLLEIAEEDEPFNFSMLTVDTHHQDGYVCSLCGDAYDEQYANVWACASEQVYDFVSWIQEQDFYENTTIIITGDHCSMDSDFYGEYTYDKHNGETVRKVYNAFINADAVVEDNAENNRLFTTLDFFPTALASLGVEIEGDRLGLGTNLYSGTETLSEIYGYDYLYEELGKKSTFYNQTLLYPSSDSTEVSG